MKAVNSYGNTEVVDAMGVMGLSKDELVDDGGNGKVGAHTDVWAIGMILGKMIDERTEWGKKASRVKKLLQIRSHYYRVLSLDDIYREDFFNPFEEENLESGTPAGMSDWWKDMEHREVSARRDRQQAYLAIPEHSQEAVVPFIPLRLVETEGSVYDYNKWPASHHINEGTYKYEAIGPDSLPCTHYYRVADQRIYKRRTTMNEDEMEKDFAGEHKPFEVFHTHKDPSGQEHKWLRA